MSYPKKQGSNKPITFFAMNYLFVARNFKHKKVCVLHVSTGTVLVQVIIKKKLTYLCVDLKFCMHLDL